MKQSAWKRSSVSIPGEAGARTLRLRLAPFVALLVLAISGATVVATGQRDAVATTTTTYTLFGAAPPTTGPDPERARLELGMVFASAKSGTVRAIRFYKHREDTGVHYGRLWDSSGRLLTSVLFRNETTSGWQTVTLARPIWIQAGRDYVVSHTTMGGYAADPTYFAAGWKRSGPLTAKKGVYRYGGGYPTQTWRSANYFSDVSVAVTQATPLPTTTSSHVTNVEHHVDHHSDDDHHSYDDHDSTRYTAEHLLSLPGLVQQVCERPALRDVGVPVRSLVAGPDGRV